MALLVAAGGSLPAFAQGDAGATDGSTTAPEPTSPPDLSGLTVAPPPGIEAIEVTGERLDSSNVQDQAQAISAFSGAELDRASIVSVDSLQFNVPGLHVGQSGQAPIITLRGIGTENASLTGEPGVAFHVDGVNVGRPATARVAFFDLETLDVKRGPQGLQGGKNSTSGSINLITRKPTDDFEIGGDVLFGNYDRQRFRGAINVPLGEFASSRFALYQENRNGFLDNKNLSSSHDPFDADDFGLRGHLMLHPTESIDWLWSYNYFQQGGSGPQADIVPIPIDPLACGTLPNNVISQGTPPTSTVLPKKAACYNRIVQEARTVDGQVTGPGTVPIFLPDPKNPRVRTWQKTQLPATYRWSPATEDSDPRSVYAEVASKQNNRYWGWTQHLDWDVPSMPLLGETQFKVFGGFQETTNKFLQDFDATSASMSAFSSDDKADQYSIETQWSGTGFGEQLEWQTNLFHLHERGARTLITPDLLSGNINLQSEQETDNKNYGASIYGSYQLTDALRFNLGGRFIKDKKENWLLREQPPNQTPTRFQGCGGILGLSVNQAGQPIPLEDNPACSYLDRETTWGAGVEWRPFGDEHLLYAKIDRGAKTGGFRAGTVGEYLPEKIWAYSAGTKSEFFDQRLRLNLEGFVYNYTDLQIVVIDGTSLRTENTDARMYGWDLEAQASPLEGMLLSAVVSYLHTETIDYLSLDPANPDQFLVSRLDNRNLADLYAVENQNIPYEKLQCINPQGNPQQVNCGDLAGTVGGYDDYSGNELSRAPRWKYTLSGEYEIPLGRFGSLTPRVQYTWQDDTYYRAFNKPFDLQESYHLTNAKLIWSSPEQRWSVEAFIENIEDKAAKQNILVGPDFLGSPALAWYGPPRFYGMQVGYKY